MFQDNQSAIKMENNGRRLAGYCSRHTHIHFFCIKDHQDKKYINVCLMQGKWIRVK